MAAGDLSLFSLGETPVWSVGSTGSVYSTLGATLDFTKGTLNVAVIDCAGTPLEGVSLTIEPAPEHFAYLGSDGVPSPARTSTIAPYTYSVSFNAPGGVTHISARGADLRRPGHLRHARRLRHESRHASDRMIARRPNPPT